MRKKISFNPAWILIIISLACLLNIILYNTNKTDPFNIPLKTQSNQSITLKQLTSKKSILVFWASWCKHCQYEVTILNQLHQKYPEIQMIGIQVDDGIPGPAFSTAQYDIYLNGAHNGSSIMQQLGNVSGSIPFIVYIDQKGNISNQSIGEITLTQLEDKLTDLK